MPVPINRNNRWHLAVLFAIAAASLTPQANADPGDETCFPLYRDTGAIPGTSSCPLTASTASVSLSTYFCTGNFGIGSITRYCGSVPKDAGPTCNGIGNPINAGTGNKYQIERDYLGTDLFPLVFERTYNSSPAAAQGRALGKLWRSTYDRIVVKLDSTTTAVHRQDGKIHFFTLTSGAWAADKDNADRLTQLKDASGATTGWTLTAAADDSVETYNASGRLVSIRARNGQTHTLTWSDSATPANVAPGPNYLIRVTDAFGRTLDFKWTSAGYLASMSDPDSQIYQFAYDNQNRLASITYPGPDAPKRVYSYNEQQYTANSNLPNALTGITDENNVRYATFAYDNSGKAISTQYANGANRYSLAYGSGQATVTDPLNTQRTYAFKTLLGAVKTTGISQPAGAGCNATSNQIAYDANGNVSARTDFNGNQTTYSYDQSRNLEIARTEGAGTAQARTITTQWHGTFRLPLKIAEPKRLTTYAYDDSGNLLKKTEQATSDAIGAQGLSASVTGSARVWTHTYNSAGHMLSAVGPRTDINDKTIYEYDGQGNLKTKTNAAGHVTTLSNYDAHGHVGRIVDPNGLITDFTYDPRGRLLSRTASGDGIIETISYAYDAAGQLKTASQSDGSVITYAYDDAHRLIQLADNQGNSIAYTLDPMGNRISETVKDPAGTLARQTTRAYDALNRLQQITGGTQ